MYVLIRELDILVFCHCAVFTYISAHDGDQIWDHPNENSM